MKGLTLILESDSVELLDDHSRLTTQQAQINEKIQKTTGMVDANAFSQLSLPVDYTGQLNNIASQVNSNNGEQKQLIKQIDEANQQIASLKKRSKAYSIVLILAVIVIIIVIAAQ